jgi:two-component system LytT family response regulator
MGRQRKYKTLVVDDSDLARADLLDVLSEFPQIEVAGEADSVASAVRQVQKLQPDLLFLDIQLPGESGFDLLEKIKVQPKIIFVTAFDKYAIRAFRVNALDYLLKPVSYDRLAESLGRLNMEPTSSKRKGVPLEYDDLLFVEMNRKMQFIRLNTILKISSAGMYTELTTIRGYKGLIYKSMKEWEMRLPEKWFVRVHRTTIINVEHIERINNTLGSGYHVVLRGLDKPVEMSRRCALKLKERMS